MKTLPLNRIILSCALAIFGTVIGVPATRADDSALKRKDKSFVQDAYQDGLAEIQSAQMAQSKTANADVKAFAEKLSSDHTAANSELKTLADAKKVTVATEPSLIAKGKRKLLDAKSGGDFDKAYIDEMITDHQKAIEAFKKEANAARDADVKAFAAKTLPTLEAHLSAAESIQQKIGK